MLRSSVRLFALRPAVAPQQQLACHTGVAPSRPNLRRPSARESRRIKPKDSPSRRHATRVRNNALIPNERHKPLRHGGQQKSTLTQLINPRRRCLVRTSHCFANQARVPRILINIGTRFCRGFTTPSGIPSLTANVGDLAVGQVEEPWDDEADAEGEEDPDV